MNQIVIVDEQIRAKLVKVHEPALLCTPDGVVMGYFTP